MTHGRDNVFALRVKGSSMIDALVNDGDLVLMEQTSAWDDGDMVAVWLRDRQETTLKKIYNEGPRIRLQPANASMDPIYARAEDVEVQGKVLYRLGPGF
jgi:repressor LexA